MSFFYYCCILLFSYILSDLDIHIIPHSHMDPGWGWTTNEYYNMRVRSVYNNVLSSLQKDSNRTFVVCEIIFFKRWYFEQSEMNREIVKSFIRKGQIEFVGGAYVMHDEANTYYQDILDQTRLGMQFLKKEFNVTPETAWSIDPFGHSAGNAYLQSQLGFKHLVVDRINYQEFADRLKNGNLEFIYHPFENNNNKELLFHITPYHYGNPVCDYCLSSNPPNANTESALETVANRFLKEIMITRKGYKSTDVFLHLLGGDFQYMINQNPFIRTQQIMDYINTHLFQNEKITISFSTPQRYFRALMNDIEKKKKQFKIEQDIDFFVYADKEYTYWSGYFTSRPYLKGAVRQGSNMLMVSSKLISELITMGNNNTGNLIELQEFQANLQHHDAITGTSNERVSDFFINTIKSIIMKTEEQDRGMSQTDLLKSKVVKVCMSNPIIDFGCDKAFEIEGNKNNEITISLYNPLIEGPVLITMEFSNSLKIYEIIDASENLKKNIPSDFYCVNNIKFGYKNKCFLSFFYNFKRENIITAFTLKKTDKDVEKLDSYPTRKVRLMEKEEKFKSLYFDPSTVTFSLEYYQNGKIQKYSFELFHGKYPGFSRGTTSSIRPKDSNNDGMYIFAPNIFFPNKIQIEKENSFMKIGSISSSIILRMSDASYLVASFYKYPSFLKVDHYIDPITSVNGENFIFGIQSDLKNNITVALNKTKTNETRAEFWTDSNGIQMMRRVSGYIHSYEHTFEEKVAVNFYPVPTSISIREKDNKYYGKNRYDELRKDDRMITIFPDRPQAGGALKEGEIMLIITRNSLRDDGKGIGSNLNERHSNNNYFKVSHVIQFGNSIFKDDNFGMKTKSFFYNYYHNSPLMLKMEKNDKVNTIKSNLNEMYKVTENIRQNFQVVNDKIIIIQFYADEDYYFMNNKDSTGMITLLNKKLQGVNILVDFNGVQSLNLDTLNNMQQFPEFFKTNTQTIALKQNEFAFVYFYFK